MQLSKQEGFTVKDKGGICGVGIYARTYRPPSYVLKQECLSNTMGDIGGGGGVGLLPLFTNMNHSCSLPTKAFDLTSISCSSILVK